MIASDATFRCVTPSALRRLSRCHLRVARASGLTEAAHRLSESLAGALREPLGDAFALRARLLEVCVDEGEGLRDDCGYAVLSLANTGENALLEIEHAIAAALVNRLAGCPEVRLGPAPLTPGDLAGIGFLVLSALSACRRAEPIETAWAARLRRIVPDRSRLTEADRPAGALVGIDLEIELDGALGGARLLLPAAAVARLCAQVPPTGAPPAPAATVLAARLVAALRVPGAALTEAEFASLAPGDAVVLSAVRREADAVVGPAWLAFDGFELRGSFDGRALAVAQVRDALPLESAMEPTSAPPPLPIAVDVELARVRVPLSELGQLRPGAVLALGVALTDTVLLRIGERAIARAELVDIEGELGARIIALLS